MLFGPCCRLSPSRINDTLFATPISSHLNAELVNSTELRFYGSSLNLNNLSLSVLAGKCIQAISDGLECLDDVLRAVDLLHSVALLAADHGNSDVYNEACKWLWRVAKRVSSLSAGYFSTADRDVIVDRLDQSHHAQLCIWTLVFRAFSLHSSRLRPGIHPLVCDPTSTELSSFFDDLNVFFLAQLLRASILTPDTIPCSCVATSWQVLRECHPSIGKLLVDALFPSRAQEVSHLVDGFSIAYRFCREVPRTALLPIVFLLAPVIDDDDSITAFLLRRFLDRVPELRISVCDAFERVFDARPGLLASAEKLLLPLGNKLGVSTMASCFPSTLSGLEPAIRRLRDMSDNTDSGFRRFAKLCLFCVSKNPFLCSTLSAKLGNMLRNGPGADNYLLLLLAIGQASGDFSGVLDSLFDACSERSTSSVLIVAFFVLSEQSRDSLRFLDVIQTALKAPDAEQLAGVIVESLGVVKHILDVGTRRTIVQAFLSTPAARLLRPDLLASFLHAISDICDLPTANLFEKLPSALISSSRQVANFLGHQILLTAMPESVCRLRMTPDFARDLVAANQESVAISGLDQRFKFPNNEVLWSRALLTVLIFANGQKDLDLLNSVKQSTPSLFPGLKTPTAEDYLSSFCRRDWRPATTEKVFATEVFEQAFKQFPSVDSYDFLSRLVTILASRVFVLAFSEKFSISNTPFVVIVRFIDIQLKKKLLTDSQCAALIGRLLVVPCPRSAESFFSSTKQRLEKIQMICDDAQFE